MSRLFPSEIARLVLGYLREKGCHKAHDEFLAESPDLNEFRSCLSGPNTYDYPTAVNGRTLFQHLNGHVVSQTPVFTPQNITPQAVLPHIRPVITNSVPSVCVTSAACVPPAAPVTTVSERELELLRRVRTNQATISALNQKMNAVSGKVWSSEAKYKSSTAERQSIQSYAVTANNRTTAQSMPSISTAQVNEGRKVTDSFKTPVKQTVRRSLNRSGYGSPDQEKASGSSSPKKSTPRKNLTPRKLSAMSSGELSIVTGSSSDADATLTPSKINKNNIHIEPEKVVEKFIQNPNMPELLAEEINKIWNSYSETGVENLVNGHMSVLRAGITTPVKSVAQVDPQLDDSCDPPFDKVVTSVVKGLEQHSTINQFIIDFAENELLVDTAFSDLDCLFGSESSPFSSYDDLTPVHSVGDDGDESGTDPGSLTTPKSSFREQAIASSSLTVPASLVKNLMQDLKTPEKKVPSASSSHFNSSPFVPSVARRNGADNRISSSNSGKHSAPVCIRIPDDGNTAAALVVQQADSPSKKLRRGTCGREASVSETSAVGSSSSGPVMGGRRAVAVPAEQLRQARRELRHVPGKRLPSKRR